MQRLLDVLFCAVPPSECFEMKSRAFKGLPERDERSLRAGVLSTPGSFAASACIRGSSRWLEFCEDEGVRWEPRRKLVIATGEAQGKTLQDIFDWHTSAEASERVRGLTMLTGGQAIEEEPLIAGPRSQPIAGALLVRSAVVDFASATRALLRNCHVIAGEYFS